MKTKPTIVLGSILIVAIMVFSAAATMMIPANDKAKENAVAVEKSPAIEGDWALNHPGLERIEFIHYKKDFAKPTCNNNGVCEPELGENPSCADCKAEEEPAPTTCYAFLGKYGKTYLKWTTLPVNYVINPTNPQNLDEILVTNSISNGAETWDASTSKELMNDAYTIDYTASYGNQDYKNTIAFGNYPTAGVIAVTSVWYNPATKAIVEFDIMFDTDWVWGDATIDSTAMDLQNIATHELGHGAGLADVYDSACSAVTMYGYSNYGETDKRTLETPDITGLQTLYGA